MDKSARQFLAKEGYDPEFGARPLKRAIQEHLLDPLAMKLLDGEFKPGDRVKVSADGEGLEFKKKQRRSSWMLGPPDNPSGARPQYS